LTDDYRVRPSADSVLVAVMALGVP